MDIETTGLALRSDTILSIGIVQIADGRIEPDIFYALCRPTGPISPEAMKIHCLTPEQLATAPGCEEVMTRASVHLRDKVLVAHAAWIERAFLDRALRARGERLPRGIVDTAALSRAVGVASPTGCEPSLEGLARLLRLPVHTPHHALGDAATTALVFLALIARLERQDGPVTVEHLLRVTRNHAA